jgi:predicted metal-dependent HD superfamily phosphohydrolase
VRATEERFRALWRRCHDGPHAVDASAMYREVARRYAEPQRRYHTLSHVDDCLGRFDLVATELDCPDAVEMALWFHDVIYEPGSPTNERESALLYLRNAGGADRTFCRRVCSLILITRHCRAAFGRDRQYLVDIDLAGFGLPWPEFRIQSDRVRDEFPSQTDDQFNAGQSPFLEKLLARPRIYATDFFHDRIEARARDNIRRLLADGS